LTSSDYVARLLAAFSHVFEPITEALASQDALTALLSDLGWDLAPNANMTTVQGAFTNVSTAITQLDQDATANASATTLGIDVAALTAAVIELASSAGGGGLPAPLDNPAFWPLFAPDLLDYLLYRYLRDHVRPVFGVLSFVGVAGKTPGNPDANSGRRAFTRLSVAWNQLPTTVSHADKLMSNVYGWGSDFDHALFIENVTALLNGFGAAAVRETPPDFILDLYFASNSSFRAGVSQVIGSPLSIKFGDALDAPVVKIGLVLLPIPEKADTTGKPVGLSLFPIVTGQAGIAISITDNVSVEVSASFEAAAVRLEVRPSGPDVAIEPIAAALDAGVTLTAARTPGWTLLGDATATHFEVDKATAGLTIHLTTSGIAAEIAADLTSKLVLDFSESDGFLKTILGPDRQEIAFSPGFGWSSRTGFSMHGQASLEAQIPLHIDIAGIISLDKLLIAIRARPDPPAMVADLAVSGGLTLGPVAASVDRVGVEITATPKDKASLGNMGLLEFKFGFKPPNGLGLAIDAGVVVGGGYIFCDPDKGEYAGVLELAIEVVQVKIIGILNTILPGGQQGFSLLLIVSAEFEPIQLSFGFTLSGVGGLAGINRTMVLEALRTGLKHHTLNSILFPVDPVAHATQIISDLQAVFPPQQNRYVFGPMIELGWGTPNLIIAELGVVIELPAPIRLAILGQMTAALPKYEAAVVLIHLDVLGTVEFEKKFLSIDATLYDSRVTVFALLGDMAMRLLWGENANFALSVGGLHPKYQPPPAFPSLIRLTLSMGSGDNPRLSCDAYFAVTSNSLQFGAGLSLYASAAGFTLEGHLGFDALFVVSPVFHFSIEISGSVDLKQGNSTLASLNLDMLLEGPNPFHASGSVSLHILFFTVSAGFDATWGDPTVVSLPGRNPKDTLLLALNDVRNWNATIPADAERAASLVAPAPDDKTVVVHPLGDLGVIQKIVPLGFHMTRFGSAAPIGVDRFDVSDVTLNGTSLAAAAYKAIPENFSPGQFQDLSENDKLSRPSFEPHPAGVQLTSNAVATGTVTSLDVEYETILVDDPLLPGTSVGLHTLDGATFLAQAGQGGAQFSQLRNTGKRKFLDPNAPDGTVRLGNVKYTVTSKKDLSVRRDIADDGTFSSVQQGMAAYVRDNPAERDDLQVTPSHQTLRQ
jgi:hypothetical protein